MLKRVFLIGIAVITLAAAETYAGQTLPHGGQSSLTPWGGQGQPTGAPGTTAGEDGQQKGGEKEKTQRENEEDYQSEMTKEMTKKKSDERLTLNKNMLFVMRGIAEITQDLVRMMEKDMSPESMTRMAPLLKDVSGEMTELQNIIAGGHASEEAIVTLRLKTEVTRKKIEQMK